MNNMYDTNSTVCSLLSWYNQEKRVLPWRDIKDPYRIWLSEVMLQQTQVQTVIPYYHRWLEIYPTLQDAANAQEEELLKVWEGLGYYNRCRNFHKALKTVVKKHNGIIPNSMNVFRQLPGVGEYIGSAVLSIAFGKPYPAIDGNILRVLCRFLGRKKISSYNKKIMSNHLINWMNVGNAGDINQALMDLGNMVCKPNQAHCFKCPFKKMCKGFFSGKPEKYPEKIKGKPIPNYNVVTGIIWKNDKFLILKRHNKNHLGGLWEFPGGKIKKGETVQHALKREIQEECGLNVSIGNHVGTIRHTYSHFSINMSTFHCESMMNENVFSRQPYRWIAPDKIGQFPFPKANHKLFSILDNNGWVL